MSQEPSPLSPAAENSADGNQPLPVAPPPLPARDMKVVSVPAPVVTVVEASNPVDGEPDLDEELLPWWSLHWVEVPSWLTSAVFHLGLLLMLAMLTTMHRPQGDALDPIVATTGDSESGAALDELNSRSLEIAEPLPPAAQPSLDVADLPQSSVDQLAKLDVGSGLAAELKLNQPGKLAGGGSGGQAGEGNQPGAAEFQGRLNPGAHDQLVREGGGTSESERAVLLSLKWLAEHQFADGSWNFDHTQSPKCHNRCGQPGFEREAKNAATALALLPFLGSGQTHKQGKYRRTVEAGLYYLVRSMQVNGTIGSLWEPSGRMYGHGLGAIALCEAYGMTRDHALQEPAQMALNYIVYAQDPVEGGWRYSPQQAGDTSVVGWQLMALKSGSMSYLKVPAETIEHAGRFLDEVQSDEGAAYGYQAPGARPATTAIGLLCRMYLGWGHDHPPLARGVQLLSELGPSTDRGGPPRNNMYYNYYATQVMHHYGGYPWRRWNEVMREYLIKTQSRHGHEQGSWYLEGTDYGTGPGGRLYFTALAAMTLEVYYRHMPLYTQQSTQQTFLK